MGRFLLGWLVVTASCWLIVGSLLAPLVPGGGWALGALALLGSAPVLVLIRGFTRPAYPSRAVRLLVLRPFWYLQLLVPLAGLAGLVGIAAGVPAGIVRGDVGSAAAAGGRIAVLGLLGLSAMFFLAGYLGSRRLVVRRYVASSPRLPAGFEGVRVVQLSDLHVGPHTPRGKLARIARATRDARPDLIALTGDLVDDYARDMEPFAEGLGRFEAPLGVFAVPGNHDVYAGWGAVRASLEAQGVRVLVNEAVRIARGDDAIVVAGTGDPAGQQWARRGGHAAAPDIAATLGAAAQVGGSGGYILALAHNPVLWRPLARGGTALTLSGHTHWGQFALPGFRWSLASLFLDEAMGAYTADDAVLFVHPGTNYWGLPFRLGTPPEVAIVTLRRGPPAFEERGV